MRQLTTEEVSKFLALFAGGGDADCVLQDGTGLPEKGHVLGEVKISGSSFSIEIDGKKFLVTVTE